MRRRTTLDWCLLSSLLETGVSDVVCTANTVVCWPADFLTMFSSCLSHHNRDSGITDAISPRPALYGLCGFSLWYSFG